jgi:hypothetical protein
MPHTLSMSTLISLVPTVAVALGALLALAAGLRRPAAVPVPVPARRRRTR